MDDHTKLSEVPEDLSIGDRARTFVLLSLFFLFAVVWVGFIALLLLIGY